MVLFQDVQGILLFFFCFFVFLFYFFCLSVRPIPSRRRERPAGYQMFTESARSGAISLCCAVSVCRDRVHEVLRLITYIYAILKCFLSSLLFPFLKLYTSLPLYILFIYLFGYFCIIIHFQSRQYEEEKKRAQLRPQREAWQRPGGRQT